MACDHRQSDSPHVAIITTSAGPIGGMETFTRALIRWLRDDDWRVTLGINGFDSFSASGADVSVHSLDWVNPTDLSGDRRYKLSVVRNRYRWFRHVRPDLALFVQSSNTPFRAAVLAARAAHVPVVMTQRTMPARIAETPSRRHLFGLLPGIGLHRKRLIWSSRLAALLSHRIVYNSHAVRSLYQQDYGHPANKGDVIPNAVYVPTLPRDRSATASGTITIGYLGRLGREKRIDVLLQALACVHDLPIRLEVYGEGPERAPLAQLTQQLKLTERVQFHGPTLEVNEAYSQFDLVVLCSPRESSSNMVLEAMAAGCATIVTRVGGLPELVGDAGICVEPLNVPQLAEAIRKLGMNEQRRVQLGCSAEQQVAAHHAPHRIAEQWTTLLRSVATRCVARPHNARETNRRTIDAMLAKVSP